MMAKGISWKKGDNKRHVGWDQLRRYLMGVGQGPLLYFLECCEDTIRTLPIVQHDEHDPEDVDTEGEDHAVDETRYAVMSRPWIPKPGELDKPWSPKGPLEGSMGEMTRKHFERRARERQESTVG